MINPKNMIYHPNMLCQYHLKRDKMIFFVTFFCNIAVRIWVFFSWKPKTTHRSYFRKTHVLNRHHIIFIVINNLCLLLKKILRIKQWQGDLTLSKSYGSEFDLLGCWFDTSAHVKQIKIAKFCEKVIVQSVWTTNLCLVEKWPHHKCFKCFILAKKFL